jgi:hypothetical protein
VQLYVAAQYLLNHTLLDQTIVFLRSTVASLYRPFRYAEFSAELVAFVWENTAQGCGLQRLIIDSFEMNEYPQDAPAVMMKYGLPFVLDLAYEGFRLREEMYGAEIKNRTDFEDWLYFDHKKCKGGCMHCDPWKSARMQEDEHASMLHSFGEV